MAADMAVNAVNTIDTDHELEGAATVLFLLENDNMKKEDVWKGFLNWPGEKSRRFNSFSKVCL